MTDNNIRGQDDSEVLAIRDVRPPDIQGRSKKLWLVGDGTCVIEIIPSLRSFTFSRDEMVPETGRLRLDFYERAAARLRSAGVTTAFRKRLSRSCYLADFHPGPPFEVIVKNRAVGSTLRKYPGLFEDGQVLPRPIVKFDYRIDPEDQPIGEDYLRALNLPVDRMRQTALAVNDILQDWLRPIELWDFCLVFGLTSEGEPIITSEISQDCMRLRNADGSPLDKDLFRGGASHLEISTAWKELLHAID